MDPSGVAAMTITITPQKLQGTIKAVASKSHVQRLLICSALADKPTNLICGQSSGDILAAVDCLRELGAQIQKTVTGYHITPITQAPRNAYLPCRESGAVLRFLLPVAGALGIDTTFVTEGRLSQRPLSPLWEEMLAHGCRLEWVENNRLHCTGKLQGGDYRIAGNISSQFVSGLKMAFPLMDGPCSLTVSGEIGSKPYIRMTEDVLALFGICPENQKQYRSPGTVIAEGDWSSAAFYFGANALGSRVFVEGLNNESLQADRAITSLLPQLTESLIVDGSDFPDLIPILAVIAAVNKGAEFINIRRLRLKESDRVASVRAMLNSLGIHTVSTENTLKVIPGNILGGTVNSFADHRIAMAAAIAATAASGPVTILDAQCVSKSYPGFWEDYQALGGRYEFDLR